MMSGDDVRQVQRTVGANVDGLFGPETKSKVIDFQASMNLVRDGIVGPKTWAAILEYSGEKPAELKPSLNSNSLLWGAAGVMMLAGISAAVYNNRS